MFRGSVIVFSISGAKLAIVFGVERSTVLIITHKVFYFSSRSPRNCHLYPHFQPHVCRRSAPVFYICFKKKCDFLQVAEQQTFISILATSISYCFSKAYYGKKYKAHILK